MTKLSALRIKPKLTRLLVIDAQNDVCDINSAYENSEYAPGKKRNARPLREAVENHVIPFLERARQHELPIGFVRSIYKLGQYSHAGISPKWLTIDTELEDPEWRIRVYRDIPKPNEPVFRKDTQDTFMYDGKDNGLSSWLEGAKYVLVAGFTASINGCVRKAVYALLERGYAPIVLEDCIATSLQKMETEYLQTLDEYKAHENI